MPHSDDGTPDCESPGLSIRDGPPKNPPCSSAHSSSLPFCLCCTISRYEKINFSLFFPAQLFNCVCFWGCFCLVFSHFYSISWPFSHFLAENVVHGIFGLIICEIAIYDKINVLWLAWFSALVLVYAETRNVSKTHRQEAPRKRL